jgi:2',3'-cyclic-nucleotide 2'-phosphodiesterase (5'-nucleotidase family)
VDKVKGTLHGVPAVMPSYWGKAIGVINYSLVVKNGKWSVVRNKTQGEPAQGPARCHRPSYVAWTRRHLGGDQASMPRPSTT